MSVRMKRDKLREERGREMKTQVGCGLLLLIMFVIQFMPVSSLRVAAVTRLLLLFFLIRLRQRVQESVH